MNAEKIPDKLPKLTPKMEQALQHFLKQGNKSAAYKSAYSCKKMSQKAIEVEASRLFKNPKITLWLNYHQNERVKDFDISLVDIKKTIATVIKKGMGNNNLMAVLKSAELMCKINGYFAPIKSNLEIENPITTLGIDTNDPIEAAKLYEKIIKGK